LPEFRETLGKIGEQLGGQFTFVAAWLQKVRYGEEAGILGHG
jgi:hypothetical protein